MKLLIFLALALATCRTYAGPAAAFEMRLENVRVFKIDGTNAKTDLVLEGKVHAGGIHGKFLTGVVSIRSEKYPTLTFSYEAIKQLATLFWEVAAYEVNQGAYKIILHYDLGHVSYMELLHPEKPHLSLDDVPLRQRHLFGRMMINELHLFANADGEVEAVNAKLAQPGKIEFEVRELDIDTSYSTQWVNGRIFEHVLEINKPQRNGPSDWMCAGIVAGLAAGFTAAYYFLR